MSDWQRINQDMNWIKLWDGLRAKYENHPERYWHAYTKRWESTIRVDVRSGLKFTDSLLAWNTCHEMHVTLKGERKKATKVF